MAVAHPWRQGAIAAVKWPVGTWRSRQGLHLELATDQSHLDFSLHLVAETHYRKPQPRGAWVMARLEADGPIVGIIQLQLYTGSSPVGRFELAESLGESPPTCHRFDDVDRLRPLLVSRVAVLRSEQGKGVGTALLSALAEQIGPDMIPIFPRAIELMRRGEAIADQRKDGFLRRAGFMRAELRARSGPIYYYRCLK